jgi:outer membrane receptor protein involved in Fe transport
VNVTYHIDADRMVYATYSKGFRPGGVNRRGTFPPYRADYLKNYEVGWKTSWLDNRLRVNGAAFVENWDDFQFAFLGANGLTNITNGAGARIRGLEADATWAVSRSFAMTGALSVLSSKLTANFCKQLDDNGLPLSPCPAEAFAPSGSELPITPKFKANVTARYNMPVGRYDGHLQGSVVYQGKSKSELVPAENALVGEQNAYTLVNVSASIDNGSYSFELFVNNLFDKRGDLYKYTECKILLCGVENYDVVTPPRLVGLKFEQTF